MYCIGGDEKKGGGVGVGRAGPGEGKCVVAQH